MLPLLHDAWGSLLLRGILALLFGAIAVILPGPALLAVVMLFGAYALVDGIFAIVAFFRARGHQGRWWFFVAGLLGIAVGVLTFFFPGMTALWLLFLVSAWSVVTGVSAIVAAFRLRKELTGEWRLYLAGLLSVAFGALLVFNLASGLLALMWVMGFWAILYGASLVALALRVKHVTGQVAHAH